MKNAEARGQLQKLHNELGHTGAVDLNKTVTCQVCGEGYEKVLPGADVCGACQVAMAIVMHYESYLYQRWGVINIGR